MHRSATGAVGFTVTWLVLLGFTVLSLAMSYVHLGVFGTPVALAIAVVKGSLVALIFMELLEARASVVLTALAGLGMFLLLASLLSVDVLTRQAVPAIPPAVHR
jgi:caa(3)-type oxidase subunit IV